jgi:hypothetical protein
MLFAKIFARGGSRRRGGERRPVARIRPGLEVLERRELPTAGLPLWGVSPVAPESLQPAHVAPPTQTVDPHLAPVPTASAVSLSPSPTLPELVRVATSTTESSTPITQSAARVMKTYHHDPAMPLLASSATTDLMRKRVNLTVEPTVSVVCTELRPRVAPSAPASTVPVAASSATVDLRRRVAASTTESPTAALVAGTTADVRLRARADAPASASSVASSPATTDLLLMTATPTVESIAPVAGTAATEDYWRIILGWYPFSGLLMTATPTVESIAPVAGSAATEPYSFNIHWHGLDT